jgi:hypothetical protein
VRWIDGPIMATTMMSTPQSAGSTERPSG